MSKTTDTGSEPPGVALIPYGTKLTKNLSNMPLDDLVWPAGRPERLARGTVAELGREDHLLAYLSSRLLYMPRPGVRARVSAMVVEPEAVHGRKMRWLKLLWWRFFKILTCNPGLLARTPNSERFLFGSTWVPDWPQLTIEKTRMLSLIASGKTYYPGHKLRHQVVAWMQDQDIGADILGRGYTPFERKSDGLAPYRYSVIIENVREPSHFTEKLIDCLLCETVPIYWGAQDIDQMFCPEGMLICDSFDEITASIRSLSEDDYRSRLEFIARNKEKAARYANHELAAARILQAAAQREKTRA
jgi:hypothetical protein